MPAIGAIRHAAIEAIPLEMLEETSITLSSSPNWLAST
jgi:hypothetical protein